jgi:type VI secretion system protein ImpL
MRHQLLLARFDELYAGLKEMSLANMAVRRGENWRRGY